MNYYLQLLACAQRQLFTLLKPKIIDFGKYNFGDWGPIEMLSLLFPAPPALTPRQDQWVRHPQRGPLSTLHTLFCQLSKAKKQWSANCAVWSQPGAPGDFQIIARKKRGLCSLEIFQFKNNIDPWFLSFPGKCSFHSYQLIMIFFLC